MARAADAMPGAAGILVVTKHAASPVRRPSEATSSERAASKRRRPMRIMEAGHPIPDSRSLAAGRAVMKFISKLHNDDLLLCLISGGGSALVAAPAAGVSLADLQTITSALLRSGASIEEINVLRRQLDTLKGGGLAVATQASILSLILSDVVGDRLEAIASGPTVPEPDTSLTAPSILKKRGIRPPESIARALTRPNPRQPHTAFQRVQNIVIGNNRTAIDAALQQANREGLHAEIAAVGVQGEARDAGLQFASRLRDAVLLRRRPFCLVAGGETTVAVELKRQRRSQSRTGACRGRCAGRSSRRLPRGTGDRRRGRSHGRGGRRRYRRDLLPCRAHRHGRGRLPQTSRRVSFLRCLGRSPANWLHGHERQRLDGPVRPLIESRLCV